MTELNVNEIEIDAGTQFRQKLDPRVVDEYGEAMLTGSIFPPLVVFSPKGSERYILADGFHRLEAAKECGHQAIAVEIREGGVRDAVEFALGANNEHGLRLSNKDKRRKIEAALKDPEWSTWSNREIARLCRVDDKTIAKVRTESNIPAPDRVKTPKLDRGDKPIEQTSTPRKSEVSEPKVRKSEPPDDPDISPRKSEAKSDTVRISEPSPRTALVDAIALIRSQPLDGGEAVIEFDLYRQASDFEFLREWSTMALDEINRGPDQDEHAIPW